MVYNKYGQCPGCGNKKMIRLISVNTLMPLLVCNNCGFSKEGHLTRKYNFKK